MKRHIYITLILILILSLSLFLSGCEEIETARPGADVSGIWVYATDLPANGNVPAFKEYHSKIEITGNTFKYYTTNENSHHLFTTYWASDCSDKQPADQLPCPLPQWICTRQGTLINTPDSLCFASDGFPYVQAVVADDRQSFSIDNCTYKKLSGNSVQTQIDGLWIWGEEHDAEGDYPAFVAARKLLAFDDGHFNYYTKRLLDSKNEDESIEADISTWKSRFPESTYTPSFINWWEELPDSYGTFTQSGRVVEMNGETDIAFNWSIIEATIMTDGTLKVQLPADNAAGYDYYYFKRAEILPLLP